MATRSRTKATETPQRQGAKTRRARSAAPSRAVVPHPTLKGHAVGQPRNVTIGAREALADVFAKLGGTAGLLRWARKNKSAFYLQLWPRLVPKDMTLTPGVGLEEMLTRLSEAQGARPVDADYTLVALPHGTEEAE